jgi:hypothetical protein
MDKPKLLILIPDGVGIKNYLLSDFIKYACKAFCVTLVHNFDNRIEKEINADAEHFKTVRIPKYNESLKHKFLRESLCYARLTYNSGLRSNPSIMVNWRRSYKQFFKKLFYKAVKIYGTYLSKSYPRIQHRTNQYLHTLKHSASISPFKDLLKNASPDLVFTTHQRALYNIPLFAAAKQLNVPSVSAIYSWDNMPKARIPYYSDYFFVWSEYMKNEFNVYYPEIESERIHITGTPQFEFYLDKNLLESKTAFFQKHGLDKSRPLVCYSGDDQLTSPFDPDYLRDLANAFLTIEKNKRPQLILRPSPADDATRFQPVLEEFPDIAYAPADWYQDGTSRSWAFKFPKKEDIKALVNLAFHADAVVNLGSTMAHDFAMFNKPAFYVNYRPEPSQISLENPNSKNWSVETIYQYEHFKSMAGLDAVYWITKKSDFKNIPDLIKNKNKEAEKDQMAWRNKVIGENVYKHASKQMVKELLSLT